MMGMVRLFGAIALLLSGIALSVAMVFYDYALPVSAAAVKMTGIYFVEKIVPLGIGVVASVMAAMFFLVLTHGKEKKDNLKPVSERQTMDQLELEEYRRFFRAIYFYHGSYPAWKAQQEYRQLISVLSPGENEYPSHFHNIDSYLDRLVGGINDLRKYHSEFHGSHGWDGDTLSDARGGYLLDKIGFKHPTFL